MSATIFLALCILGCDFLLYALFQFTYGEKRRGLSRRSHVTKNASIDSSDARPFLVASRKSIVREEHSQHEPQRKSKKDTADPGLRLEARAYRRIAKSFAQTGR